MTMLGVLLRYAVEGIASSLRRLAPRNDNHKCRGRMGEACLAPTGKVGDSGAQRMASYHVHWVVPLIRQDCIIFSLARGHWVVPLIPAGIGASC